MCTRGRVVRRVRCRGTVGRLGARSSACMACGLRVGSMGVGLVHVWRHTTEARSMYRVVVVRVGVCTTRCAPNRALRRSIAGL